MLFFQRRRRRRRQKQQQQQQQQQQQLHHSTGIVQTYVKAMKDTYNLHIVRHVRPMYTYANANAHMHTLVRTQVRKQLYAFVHRLQVCLTRNHSLLGH